MQDRAVWVVRLAAFWGCLDPVNEANFSSCSLAYLMLLLLLLLLLCGVFVGVLFKIDGLDSVERFWNKTMFLPMEKNIQKEQGKADASLKGKSRGLICYGLNEPPYHIAIRNLDNKTKTLRTLPNGTTCRPISRSPLVGNEFLIGQCVAEPSLLVHLNAGKPRLFTVGMSPWEQLHSTCAVREPEQQAESLEWCHQRSSSGVVPSDRLLQTWHMESHYRIPYASGLLPSYYFRTKLVDARGRGLLVVSAMEQNPDT